MGKKDAQAHQGAPVEKYRKQIGKDHNKKNKKEIKEAKKKSDLKKSAVSIKEVILMLLSLAVIVVSIYVLFYWYIGEQIDTSSFKKTAEEV